jgi:hypothetical protein
MKAELGRSVYSLFYDTVLSHLKKAMRNLMGRNVFKILFFHAGKSYC